MINAAKLISDERTTPVSILRAMYKEMGHEWVNWEPEVIWDEILDQIGVDPPRVNKDKIMALKLCIMTTVPWEDWHPFTVCLLCFNDVPVEMDTAQESSPAQLAYGINILSELQPDHEYRRDVQFMAASILLSNGICWMPEEPVGEIVNEALEHLIENTSNDTDSIKLAKINYKNYKENGIIDRDDIHTTRLVAIDEYLKYKKKLEDREVV